MPKPRIIRPYFEPLAALIAQTGCSVNRGLEELGIQLTDREVKRLVTYRAFIEALAEAKERQIVGPTTELKSGRYLTQRWNRLDASKRKYRRSSSESQSDSVSSTKGPSNLVNPVQPKAYEPPPTIRIMWCPICGPC
jgi:hypothetical protein